MTRFVVGDDRSQSTLFPERVKDYLSEDNSVRAIDVLAMSLIWPGGRVSEVRSNPGENAPSPPVIDSHPLSDEVSRWLLSLLTHGTIRIRGGRKGRRVVVRQPQFFHLADEQPDHRACHQCGGTGRAAEQNDPVAGCHPGPRRGFPGRQRLRVLSRLSGQGRSDPRLRSQAGGRVSRELFWIFYWVATAVPVANAIRLAVDRESGNAAARC
jgi:hypothetical protein